MVITQLDKAFRHSYTAESVVDIKVYKTEHGFYTAEIVWFENEYPTASELMGFHGTIAELNKEFHLCSDDFDFEIIVAIKEEN